MILPVEIELRAFRGVPFVDVTQFVGQNYSDAYFRIEVRRYRDEGGEPLFVLESQPNPLSEGISLQMGEVDGVISSNVQIRINETTLEALPFTSPRGGEFVCQYALDVTGGGFGKHRRMQGPLIVEPSANA